MKPEKKQQDDRTREEELDRFWNIDALLPTHRQPPPSRNTDTVEIELEERAEPTSNEGETVVVRQGENLKIPTGKHFIPPHTADENKPVQQPLSEYAPESYLLHRVRIYPWRSAYRYYEEFYQTAEHLANLPGRRCEPVPFFSYVPQYSQMRKDQLAWYLWWRECFRNGETLSTDYSYLLLYVYELINRSESSDPGEIQLNLLKLWSSYREQYPQLDSYLPEWICDHALIHRLTAPEVSPALRSELMKHCALKEFYVPGSGEDGYVRCLLSFSSGYDYQKSKFYTDDHKELYDRVIFTVLKTVTEREETAGFFTRPDPEDSRLTRDSYTGALCSYRIKRKIEVSYSSLFRSHEMRFLVSDVVKYTENHLRAHLGIRSRMSIYALPTPLREWIDGYFARELPPGKTERKQPVVDTSYERRYELPSKPFSLADAEEIERASWNTTKRLIDAFETPDESGKPEPPKPVPVPVAPTEASVPQHTVPEEQLPADDRDFLRAVLAGDKTEQRNVAARIGKMSDAIADVINGIAVDLSGDILLEETDNGYAVIEDYRAFAESLLSVDRKE